MSTPNINIANSNITGKCDLKCAYHFKYSTSNSNATNNGVFISITYDSTSNPPVLYNQKKYTVGTITIVYPSVHLFNGVSAPAEIMIEHIPVLGGNNLNVCIPMVESSETSAAGEIVTTIITTVSTNAPSEGETTNLNMTNFNLQAIVPKKPFYVYSESSLSWVVYGDLEAIPLSSTTIATLQEIISPYAMQTTSSELYYNAKGPESTMQIGDGLYISCQPTGSSTEETPVEYNKTSYAIDLTKSPIFKTILFFLIMCICYFIFFYGISAIYKKITSSSSSLSVGSIPTIK